MEVTTNSHMIGDGGEYFIAAMLNLHGIRCAVMPRGWPGYDLIANTAVGVRRIQVKTADSSRQEWNRSPSMKMWNPTDTSNYDWLALVLWLPNDNLVKAWIVPASIAEAHRHTSKTREILYSTVTEKLSMFSDNWTLSLKEST